MMKNPKTIPIVRTGEVIGKVMLDEDVYKKMCFGELAIFPTIRVIRSYSVNGISIIDDGEIIEFSVDFLFQQKEVENGI